MVSNHGMGCGDLNNFVEHRAELGTVDVHRGAAAMVGHSAAMVDRIAAMVGYTSDAMFVFDVAIVDNIAVVDLD